MGNKKNIDQLFQEQFKGFHQTPNKNIWEQIEQDLSANKKRKRALPFWMVFSGVAATITVLVAVAVLFLSEKTTPNIIVNTAKPTAQEKLKTNENNPPENVIKSIKNTVILDKTRFENNSLSSTTNNTSVATPTKKEKYIKTDNTRKNIQIIAHYNNVKAKGASSEKNTNNTVHHSPIYLNTSIQNKSVIANNQDVKGVKNTNKINTEALTNNNITVVNNPSDTVEIPLLISNKKIVDNYGKLAENNISTLHEKDNATNINDTQENTTVEENIERNKQTITEAIAAQETDKKEEEEKTDLITQDYKKWDVATAIAPVYYNTLSNGSPIDEQFKSNTKKGQVNTSYGVNVTYALNKKFSIRTGIHKLELGYDTQDVAVFSVSSASGGVGSNELKGLNAAPGVNLNISNTNSFSVSQIPSSFSTLFDSSLNQRLGYIEVPVEVGYQIANKKMKINILAGMSTFILNKNEIYTETNQVQTYLGSGNNLNKTSFSTNIGIGFNYNLSKHLNFNVEPTFKYQVNAFTKDAGNFKPYILGIYTGFSFKF